jgi:hypothetical protein
MSNTSEFSVPEPFAPKPKSYPDETALGATPVPGSAGVLDVPRRSNIGLYVVLAAATGFAAGYAFSRYEQTLLGQSRLDEFLDYAGDWFRDNGPKLTEPLRQGLETTGSTVGQAIKDVAASAPSFDRLNPFRQPPKRKPVFGLF